MIREQQEGDKGVFRAYMREWIARGPALRELDRWAEEGRREMEEQYREIRKAHNTGDAGQAGGQDAGHRQDRGEGEQGTGTDRAETDRGRGRTGE